MKEKKYKGYTIVVSELDTNLGRGFRASFFIKKGESYLDHQCYETYRRGYADEVFADVEKIIDAVCI